MYMYTYTVTLELSCTLYVPIQRKECYVQRVFEEVGEAQEMPAPEHDVIPTAPHATHHEVAPAHSGNIEQDAT